MGGVPSPGPVRREERAGRPGARLWGAAAALAVALAAVPAAAAGKSGFAIDTEATCTTSSCHAEMGKKKFVHTVVKDGEQCVLCHEPKKEGRHGFQLVAQGGELCAQCHGTMAEKAYKHVPVAQGMCTVCHDPHQSDFPAHLNFPPTSELCFTCHDEEDFAAKVTHGPVARGQCLKCHDPHTSDQPSQLLAEVPGLCFRCHDRTLKDADGTPLPAVKRLFEDAKLTPHPPFAAGMCTACHEPHVSANYRLLVGPFPKSPYTRFSPDKYFCFNCHDEDAFTTPRTLDLTDFRNGNLNLHYRHVNRKKGRSCRLCHNPHAAPYPRLIRDRTPFGHRYITIRKFVKTETGGTCAPTCHRQVSYDRYDPVDNPLRVTPRKGRDATPEELKRAKKEQMGK